ncbi:MAG: hypothetical protein FJ404_05275 [Verrucomicrobia bacterium]|nr:hypothetical protein [Verrucomicrobiota bacterium]
MKFKPTRCSGSGFGVERRASAGFTLAEVLAALLFMAIVIPVAVQAVRVAGLAGQVGERRSAAARIGDRLLQEMIATRELLSATQSGMVREGGREYRWRLRTEPWPFENLTEVTLQVFFDAQGQEYDATLTTLVDPETFLGVTTSSRGGTL